jgi:predicted DNA-binding transcriptional regulator AlpA
MESVPILTEWRELLQWSQVMPNKPAKARKSPRRELPAERLIAALRTGMPATLSAQDVLNLLGIRRGTLNRWVQDGMFPRQSRMSRPNSRLWNAGEVAAWMREKDIPMPEPQAAEGLFTR